MEMVYSEIKGKVILKDAYSRFEDEYALGELLIDFVELDMSKVKEIIINGLDLIPPRSEDELKEHKKIIWNIYNDLIKIHPYFYYSREHIDNFFIPKDGMGYGLGMLLSINEETFNYKEDDVEIPGIYEDLDSDGRVIIKYDTSDKSKLLQLKDHFYQTYISSHESIVEAIDMSLKENSPYSDLNDLSSSQRYYAYQLLNKDSLTSQITVKKIATLDDEINFTNSTLQSDSLKEIALYIKNSKVDILEVINGSPISLCYYELLQLATREITLPNCANCGKYFIRMGRPDTKYCDRLSGNSDKTCRQIGPLNAYKENTKNDPIMKEYNKAYNRMHSRRRSRIITKNELNEWVPKAIAMREDVRSDKISLEEFRKWLGNK